MTTDVRLPVLMRQAEVLRYLGVSRATLYRWTRRGAFPKPVEVAGTRSAFWRRRDVEAWHDRKGEG